ncbi:MMPL family transporter [Cohnella lubricantis]|nr:MMPL family transporter [Cohnella lubricantis]
MLYRMLAAVSIRYRRPILCGWLLFASASAWFAAQLPNALGDHGLTVQGSYAETQQILASQFKLPDEPVVVLFANERGETPGEFHRYIANALGRAEQIRGVEVAASPLRLKGMENGGYAYALLSVPDQVQEKREAVAQLREQLPVHPEFKAMLTGKPVVQEDVNQSSRHDLKAAEAVGLPVAFALLFLAFGGLLPAMIPILAGGMSVLIAMGILDAIGASGIVELSVFVYNVIPMVGMAVSLDFALLMVCRYREEKAALPSRQAVHRAMSTSGRAVLVSVVCVILALIGTFCIRMPIFNSVALGAIVVLAVSALINLTFVPALLYALGNRISPIHSRASRQGPPSRGWRLWLSAVMKRPGVSALACAAALAMCLLPIASMRMSIPGPDSLPSGTESREAAGLFADRFFPPKTTAAYVIIRASGARQEADRTADRIRSELERDARVLRIDTQRSSASGDYLLAVRLIGEASSDEAMRWVRERERQYGSLNVLIGGEPKEQQEIHDEMINRMPEVLAFVAVSNFLVLAFAFRSLFIPLKAIAMNLLSIGAALGILSWLFREGRLGLEPSDLAIMIPVFLFGLTFGISMDYGIFLLSRIYESYRRTRDNEAAIREGVAASGRMITSAAAIMIAVTAPFSLAGVTGVKQLGLGIAAALLIDATIIRMVLVPSLMKLMGKWNWWMPFARGGQPR